MLVLSRRLHEKVLFPGFNTAVEVLSVKAGKVRLGIDAPAAVTVLRDELHDPCDAAPLFAEQDSEPAKIRHLLCNRLDVAEIGLSVLTRQVQAGLVEESQTTLEKIREDLQLLRQRLERIWWADRAAENKSVKMPWFGAGGEKRRPEIVPHSTANEFEDAGACCGV